MALAAAGALPIRLPFVVALALPRVPTDVAQQFVSHAFADSSNADEPSIHPRDRALQPSPSAPLARRGRPHAEVENRRNLRESCEFYVTKRFLSLLSDRGPRFTTAPLPLKVTGGGRDLQQLLVQKRDGRHYVLLWRDVEVAEPYPRGTRLRVAPVDITVRFAPTDLAC